MAPSSGLVKKGTLFKHSRPTFIRNIPAPPSGFVPPPKRKDHETTSNSDFASRMVMYQRAYATLSPAEWKHYATFGIQTFDGYESFFETINASSDEMENLRIVKYYKFHLESDIVVPAALLKRVGEIEIIFEAMSIHEGYFHLSVREMQRYVNEGCHIGARNSLTPETMSSHVDTIAYPYSGGGDEIDDTPEILFDNDDDISMHIPEPDEMQAFDESPFGNGSEFENMLADTVMQLDHKFKETIETPLPIEPSAEASVASNLNDPSTRATNDFPPSASFSTPSKTKKSTALELATPPRTNSTTNVLKKLLQKTPDQPVAMKIQEEDPSVIGISAYPPSHVETPEKITPIIRIEVRWAPKDFIRMKTSSSFMHERLAPILSHFNNAPMQLAEWQSDQLSTMNQPIPPTAISKFLSVRIITASKQKCFFFSFRVQSTGQNFVKSLKTKVFKSLTKGESLQFAPSQIDCTESEIVTIGDILLKDAEVTHRQKYVDYLRSHVLPADTPQFDIKIKRRDPMNNKTHILSVKCSTKQTTSLTTILSEALNGDDEQSEIFISNIGLAKHKTSRIQHEQLYRIHQEYLSDIRRIEFQHTNFIDTPTEEYLDSGEVIHRTPRQWAKQLKDDDNNFCGIDIENGATDGKTYLLVPSQYLDLARQQLFKYNRQKNPALMKATSLCSQVIIDPDIPMVVFTRNISRMLLKSFGKPATVGTAPTNMEDQDISTPLVGVATTHPKENTNAWSAPLPILKNQKRSSLAQACKQQSVAQTPTAPSDITNSMSSLTQASREQQQLNRIAELEARLESAESRGTNSHLSKLSNPSESTSSRLSEVESSLNELKAMMKLFMGNKTLPPHSVTTASTVDVSMCTGNTNESPPLMTATTKSSPTRRSLKASSGVSASTSLSAVLKIRETDPATASYSQLAILPKHASLSPQQTTPIGKKRRTNSKQSPKKIIPIPSQYNVKDYSDEMSE